MGETTGTAGSVGRGIGRGRPSRAEGCGGGKGTRGREGEWKRKKGREGGRKGIVAAVFSVLVTFLRSAVSRYVH